MRWLHNLLPLAPCGKPQAAHFAHLVDLLLRLVGAHPCALVCAGFSLRPPGRGCPGGGDPQLVGELLALDASFVPKGGNETWGLGWFWSGMARAARRGLEVSLLVTVDAEEGGAYPLCARQSPGAVPSRRQTCGAATGRETTVA